jgi:hypothetical protein
VTFSYYQSNVEGELINEPGRLYPYFCGHRRCHSGH